MKFLPIFLRVRARPCPVVGGGEVAARKVSLLQRAGAKVRVVSPTLSNSLASEAAAGNISHRASEFTPDDLPDAVLVTAATDDSVVNETVAKAAQQLGLPVNVVDEL